jgi:GTP:adenosylcobinamide-phosphate guanylyltransferase
VSAIDLARLAKLVGCSVHDLAEGARAGAGTMHAEGVMASAKSELMFEMQPISTDEEPTGVTTALISVASRPGVLDQGALPKVLTPLGGEPLITHVLRQLALGGINRVVIVLGARGSVIRSAIEDHFEANPSPMKIEFVELGEQYAAGFACSLLEARHALGRQPFLLCTADHIFDPKLVSSLREVPLAGWDTDAQYSAVALIETQVETLKDALPLTAVRVRLRDGIPAPPIPSASNDSWGTGAPEPVDIGPELLPVRHIGRSIGTPVHGIEAGLYACGPDMLDALQAQKNSRAYFTLAQAMGDLASRSALAAQTTGSRAWYAVETPDQLQLAMDSVVEGEGDESHPAHTYFPWQVRANKNVVASS